jgi:hypothetical protein
MERMQNKVTIHGIEVKFPSVCLVCQAPAQKQYNIDRTFSYGKSSMTVTIPIPLCVDHHKLAVSSSSAEKTVGLIGLVLGLLSGAGVAYALWNMWSKNPNNDQMTLIFMAGFFGISALIILWSIFSFWLAPMFAGKEAKAVRNVMKIRRFWPAKYDLQLEFVDPKTAQLVAAVNSDNVLKIE